MRWERLFADIEAEAQAEQRRLIDGEVAERSRYEFGLVTIADRLGGLIGAPILASVTGGTRIDGRVRAVGADWLLVAEGPHRGETLIALRQVIALGGISAAAPLSSHSIDGDSEMGGRPTERLLLRHLMRGLGRDRAAVAIHTVDSAVHCGTIDRVGHDHADLAVHPVDVARRADSVSETRILTLRTIAVVRVSRA